MFKRKDNLLAIVFFGYLLLTPVLVKWLGGAYIPVTIFVFMAGATYASWKPKQNKIIKY